MTRLPATEPLDVCSQLRAFVQHVADGDTEKPAKAFLMTFDEDGNVTPMTFAMGNDCRNELMHNVGQAIAALAGVVVTLNAEASN